jgi:dienelactone hydrolase
LLGSEANENPDQLFAYDRSAGFDVKRRDSETSDKVVTQDIEYASYQNRHGRIKAYLVRPEGTDSLAGIVFFHWLGKKKSNRTQFLDEAATLARTGAASLLIQGFFPWSEPPVDGETDLKRIIDQTIEVRRAIDLLLSQPGVDRQRIGFVGHDYGAIFGAIVAGLEHRPKTYVFIAGSGTFSEWSLKYWPKTAQKGEKAYRDAVSVADPVKFIGRAAPASVLFQFSTNDKYIPRAAADLFFQGANEPKTVKWYDADHALDLPAAADDRRTWLTEQLGLKH